MTTPPPRLSKLLTVAEQRALTHEQYWSQPVASGPPPPVHGSYLLDANTLIALLDPQHVQHRAVRRWFGREAQPRGWATCPSSERVVLAVMSHPDYPGRLTLEEAAMVLWRLRRIPGHAFWPEGVDLFPLPPLVLWDQVPGAGALADLELLAVASKRGGVLVTLGRRLALRGLRGPSRFRHWQPLEPILAAQAQPPPRPTNGPEGARLPATRA